MLPKPGHMSWWLPRCCASRANRSLLAAWQITAIPRGTKELMDIHVARCPCLNAGGVREGPSPGACRRLALSRRRSVSACVRVPCPGPLLRGEDHSELSAALDDAGDHCLAHRSLERSSLVDIDTVFEKEPLEALWLEGGYHPHVAGPLVAKGVHGTPRDVHVLARSERSPRTVSHDPKPAGGHIEALVGVLVVVRRRTGHTRRCEHFDSGDAAADWQQRDAMAYDPKRLRLVGVHPHRPILLGKVDHLTLHAVLRYT